MLDLQDYYLRLEDWSRDGKYILATESPFLARHENRVLALISLETHEIAFLDTPDRDPKERWADRGIHPRFSPGGDYIACRVNQSETENRHHLHIQSLDGKRHFLTDEPSNFRFPHWSPDGNYIVYVGLLGKDASLYAVKVSEGRTVGRPFIVIPNFGSNLLLLYTPGGQLAYSPTILSREYGRAPKGQRVYDTVPGGRWHTTTLVGSLHRDGQTTCMALERAIDGLSSGLTCSACWFRLCAKGILCCGTTCPATARR